MRIGPRIGVHADPLRGWCKKAAIGAGERPAMTTGDAAKIKQLEGEVRELERRMREAAGPFQDDPTRGTGDDHRDPWLGDDAGVTSGLQGAIRPLVERVKTVPQAHASEGMGGARLARS